jgi:hypothetical protein
VRYDVTRAGPGGIDVIEIDAESGDDAAKKAWKPGTVIRGVHPSPLPPEEASKPEKLTIRG